MKGSVMDDCPVMTQCFSRIVGGAKTAGKLLSKSARTICGWISGDHAPDVVSTIRMRNVLIKSENKEGYGISLEELERRLGVDLSHLRHPAFGSGIACDSASRLEELNYFERLKASKCDALWQVERRGRPSKITKNSEKKCADPHTFEGRISDFIREKYALGGKDQCKQAEVILRESREDLMQAVVSGVLYMTEAYQLLRTPTEQVAVLLLQGKVAVRAFLNKQREFSLT